MKCFYFLLAALALSGPALAAPPTCGPLLETVYVAPADPGAGWDYVVAWPCGTTPVVEFITRGELMRFAPAVIAGTPLNTEQVNEAYNAAPRVRNPVAQAQERRIRVNLFGEPPVASEGVAYKQRLAPGTVNPITYVAIGTLPKTTPCVRVAGMDRAGTFMPVAREAVTLYSKRDVFPLVTYALCF